MSTAVVIEQSTLVRRGIQALLPRSGIRCIGSASSGTDGTRLIAQTKAQIAVVGTVADTRHAEIVERLTATGCRTVVITPIGDLMAAYQLYQAGALGVLAPTAREDEFDDLFAAATRGQRYVAANLLVDALESPGPPAFAVGAFDLTAREREVLAVLALGCTNREIADRLCIGAETVKSHLNNIYAKFAVSRRSQAVSLAIRNRLL